MQFTTFDESYLFTPLCLQNMVEKKYTTPKDISESIEKYLDENNLMRSDIVVMDDTIKNILNIQVGHKATINKMDLFKMIGRIVLNENTTSV